MRFLPTITLAALTTGAVATRISSPRWDKYAEERGFTGHEDPQEFGHGGLQAREADPEAIESWEHAHGSQAPTYKLYGEHEGFGQHAARSEPVFHGDRYGHGRDQPLHAAHHARSAPEHFGHPFEGHQHGSEHHARSVPATPEGHRPGGDKHYDESQGHEKQHFARAMKDTAASTSLARPEAEAEAYRMPYEHASLAEHDGYHHARDAEARMPFEHTAQPFPRPHQARDAEARMPYEHASPAESNEHGQHRARDAGARMPYEHTVQPFPRPHQAREAEAQPVNSWSQPAEAQEEGQNYFSKLSHAASQATAKATTTQAAPAPPQGWRVYARNAATTTQQAAHPTEAYGWAGEEGAKYTAAKTAAPKMAGGWGFPW
ncbi:hypothetical protein B0A55_08147 [Friedmanniomyces simplex]|uniref:Uncharacterized protein n=1 Tax=Friedmanniomyces simplex TaxID=329884 RepID=A0A4U0WWY6_9PEZI|nr:hypothetical protein B0A55_08147 [Friedmanniomyces simplex]